MEGGVGMRAIFSGGVLGKVLRPSPAMVVALLAPRPFTLPLFTQVPGRAFSEVHIHDICRDENDPHAKKPGGDSI
jgi:hypothetical protein